MSVEKVREYLKQFGKDEDVKILDVSSATVQLAAAALDTEEARIAKTLGFIVNDTPVLVVACGDMKIDNKAFKQEFETKAKMIPFDNVGEITGHHAGGVCPFGINQDVKVYLDESLKRFDYVYPAAGEYNAVLKMSIDELEKYCQNFQKWIKVCK